MNSWLAIFSSLILAPGEDANGSLELHEVYGMELKKADLVVLSVCQSNSGAHSRGDDITGLSRAFLYAGAPTVISSLWNVDDQATNVRDNKTERCAASKMCLAEAYAGARVVRSKEIAVPSPCGKKSFTHP